MDEKQQVSEENAVHFGEDGRILFRGTIFVDQFLEALATFMFLPPGKALLTNYLTKKVNDEPPPPIQIPEEPNLYNIHPEDLAKNHHLRDGMQPMFFFTRINKGNKGEQDNSEKVDGFWKILEADLPVKDKKKDGQIIGFKNRLEFSGNQRTKTQWRMNEFRLNQKEEESNITKVDEWVVCRIYKHRYKHRSRNDEEAWDAE